MKKGNMYEFVDIKYNPLAGECFHKCGYCSTESFKRYPGCAKKYSGPPRIDEKQINKNLGKNKFVFVASQNDLFAQDVSQIIVEEVLANCKKYPTNTYLFQTKNPIRLSQMIERFWFPINSIFCFTVETNRYYPKHMGNCIEPEQRLNSIWEKFTECQITIEPIMDFDFEQFYMMISHIKPSQINIGADSKNHHLPEPSKEKLLSLISELEKFTKVKLKSNLHRIIKDK